MVAAAAFSSSFFTMVLLNDALFSNGPLDIVELGLCHGFGLHDGVVVDLLLLGSASKSFVLIILVILLVLIHLLFYAILISYGLSHRLAFFLLLLVLVPAFP